MKTVTLVVNIVVEVPDTVDPSTLYLGNKTEDFTVQSEGKNIESKPVYFWTSDVIPPVSSIPEECPNCGCVHDPKESCCDEYPEDNMTDVEADADTLSSCGWGTDEDYGG